MVLRTVLAILSVWAVWYGEPPVQTLFGLAGCALAAYACWKDVTSITSTKEW